MLHSLILKVIKFHLPPSKRFGTVVKNILGGHHAPPMSNRVKTYFEKIFAKLNNQRAAATFFLRCLKHFEHGEISSAWKLLKLNAPGYKNLIFKSLNPFPGGKYTNSMACSPLFERESLCVISPKIEKIPKSNVSCKISFSN